MHENQTILQNSRRKLADGVCPRCGSHSIVVSRHRGIEGWFCAVFPMNVYRCVECYSRFWMRELMFANSKRVGFWGSLVLLICIGVFLQLRLTAETQVLNRTAEFIPQFDNSEVSLGADQGSGDVTSNEAPITSVLSDSGVEEAANQVSSVILETESGSDQLTESKIQSAHIEKSRKDNAERLEKAVSNDTAALASLLKVDMNHRVERWRDAWESGFADYYLGFYSDSFKPDNGLTFSQWVEQRKARIKPEKRISIKLSGFEVTFSEDLNQSTVIFNQQYYSPNYSELSRKKLSWLNEKAGWRIVSEVQLDR